MHSDLRFPSIGGDFHFSSLFPYLQTEAAQTAENVFFPAQVAGKSRLLFETGVDALAYLFVEKIQKGDKKHPVAFPLHYCEATIARFLNLLHYQNREIEVLRYEEATRDALTQLPPETALILSHFNDYSEEIRDLTTALKQKGYVVIEDFVQAPFSLIDSKADFFFNSLRKIAPINIAVAYMDGEEQIQKPAQPAYMLQRLAGATQKDLHLTAGANVNEETFLTHFANAETLLQSRTAIAAPTATDLCFFKQLGFSAILEQRQKNYAALHEQLADAKALQILPGNSFFLMVRLQERDALLQYLRKLHIYCPVHWRDAQTTLSKEVLSIPIDQRYDTEQMTRIGQLIKSFFHGN